VKQPGRETDHSSSSSAEVMNECSYTSTPQYALMAWCLVKHKDIFTLLNVTQTEAVETSVASKVVTGNVL